MFFSSIKEINRLVSKGMSNIYLKITIEKNWRSQNFDVLSLNDSSPRQFLGSPNSRKYYWIFKLLVEKGAKGAKFWEQKFVWLLYDFNFERNYDVLQLKSPCFLLNKKLNFNKNETESKIENPTHSFGETRLLLQLI